MVEAGVADGQGSSRAARRAISALLPEAVLHDAVDTYVHRRPGAELARSVLWRIKPRVAAVRCLEIFRSDAPVDVRRSAVELFRVVAVEEDLPAVGEFLADPDPGHPDPGVRAVVARIRGAED
jgi:hypothetical protein